MANTFYYDACNVDSKNTPYTPKLKNLKPDPEGLDFFVADNEGDGKLMMPHSIMNEHVAINYRTIYNGYALFRNLPNFTEYSDYERCMSTDAFMAAYLRDKRNPTYKNIIQYYGDDSFDPFGLARYRMQDFIYLKYYNQIPNNYMVTLRRYTRPCSDHMFGLDMSAIDVNRLNGYSDDYVALATAVTYMGEQTGNKLSDILKFDYGANWEEKEGKTESIQNPDGGLAAQMKNRMGISDNTASGTATLIDSKEGITFKSREILKFAIAVQGKGVGVNDAIASQHAYEGNTFNARYGESLYGDVNVVNKVKMRSRGLTFSNSFSLTFEYSLKSLKCVNPRIAMMDILSNFLVLTGNYGTFWGGATIFYGNRNIAPQYGDPDLLRQGKYGSYISSLVDDVKEGFKRITNSDSNGGNFLSGLLDGIKNIGSGFIQGLVGNLLGGNVGVAGEGVAVPALLSGAPSGFWHVTVGNPLDPIAMMGNMAVTKTTVQFGDTLGYDDFPTEIKFTVDLEHCKPRDNAGIEAMFNGGKGRFYAFTNGEILKAYQTVDSLKNFQNNNNMTEQERTTGYTPNGTPYNLQRNHGRMSRISNNMIRTIGGHLNG